MLWWVRVSHMAQKNTKPMVFSTVGVSTASNPWNVVDNPSPTSARQSCHVEVHAAILVAGQQRRESLSTPPAPPRRSKWQDLSCRDATVQGNAAVSQSNLAMCKCACQVLQFEGCTVLWGVWCARRNSPGIGTGHGRSPQTILIRGYSLQTNPQPANVFCSAMHYNNTPYIYTPLCPGHGSYPLGVSIGGIGKAFRSHKGWERANLVESPSVMVCPFV